MDDGVLIRTIAEETVKRVAPGATIHYEDTDRGWVGDVPKFLYSVDKLAQLGWEPKYSSLQAIVKAIDQIASRRVVGDLQEQAVILAGGKGTRLKSVSVIYQTNGSCFGQTCIATFD